MTTIFPGRYTAEAEGEFVVFIVGMRINQPWRVRKWWPAFRAMPRMLRELSMAKDLGLLSYELMLAWPGFVVIQYWRSFEALEAYAWARDRQHLPASGPSTRRWVIIRQSASGTKPYVVRPSSHEAIYRNMPRFGLARAFGHAKIDAGRNTARARIVTR